MANMITAGERTTMKLPYKCKGWFEECRDELEPAIDKKQQLLVKMRALPKCDAAIKALLKEASKAVDHKIAIAKANWSRKRAKEVHKMCNHLKSAWMLAKETTKGKSCHHNKPVAMKMKEADGSYATTDKENLKVFQDHLHGVSVQ